MTKCFVMTVVTYSYAVCSVRFVTPIPTNLAGKAKSRILYCSMVTYSWVRVIKSLYYTLQLHKFLFDVRYNKTEKQPFSQITIN